MNLPFLSLLIFIPLLGSLVIALFVPRKETRLIRSLALLASAVPVVLVAVMWGQWGIAPVDGAGMKFAEAFDWIPTLGISYYLGVDGMSFTLVALTALMTIVAVSASGTSIKTREKDYYALLLLLETGMMGVFMSLDYVLFYVFWEVVLVPMYFLIGIWGGPRREYAAIKFFIYTLVASVIMLIGILGLYFGTGAQTFNMLEIANTAGAIPFAVQQWIFIALFFGFAVKVPVFPFHTWLPDAHVEAPTPISVVLAAVLLKMGTYGFVRISHPTLPEAAQYFAVPIAILGLINIIYGALAAMAQKDLKKLVAYSSISHMGFVLLGVAAATPAAINGAVYMMISHGLISGMMFLLVGAMYERTHTREIAKLGGMYITMPVIATVMAFSSFANLGLPGLAGFISEFFVLAGTWPWNPTYVGLAVIGMIIVAAFNLWMMMRVLMGPQREEYAQLEDITPVELVTYAPVVAFIVILGVYPAMIMDLINGPVMQLVDKLGKFGGM